MACRNLMRAKARSALAVITIAIGVIAVASLGRFGVALETGQTAVVGDIGNEIRVTPAGDSETVVLDERDRRDVERIAGSRDVAPVIRDQRTHNSTGESVPVQGVGNPDSLYDAREGRIPTNWRSGVLVGSEFADDHDLEPGQSIELDGETYRINAILEEEGQVAVANPNDAIVVPPSEIDIDGYSALVIQATDPREASTIAEEIRESMNKHEDRVSVTDFSEFAEQFDEAFQQIRQFLISVGAISLLVGGISISNVMLMSAMERHEEIGVLRAVGYQRLDVLGIMLAEAAVLGVIGAGTGVVVSGLAIMGINGLILDDPMAFQATTAIYVLVAFIFGVGTSIVAGLYPAWKASQKPPVEALRG